MAVKAGDAVWLIGGDTAPLERALRESAADIKRTFEQAKRASTTWLDTLSNVGNVLTGLNSAKEMVAGITRSIQDALQPGIDFRGAMAGAMAQLRPEEVAQFRTQLESLASQLGRDTVFSAKEAAEAMDEMFKAGITVQDVLGGGLQNALSLASAGQLDLKQAAEIAANALNQFNLKGSDMEMVANRMAGAANLTTADISDFGQALNQAGLVASQMKIPFEDTNTALSLFAQSGLKGSDAGTSFKAMLLQLTPQTKEAADIIKKLGLEFFDASGQFVGMRSVSEQLQKAFSGLTQEQSLAYQKVLFGSDAIRASNVLVKEGAEGWDKMTGAIREFSAEDVAARKLDSIAGDIEMMTGSMDTLKATIVTALEPSLRSLAGRSIEMINAMEGWVSANRVWIGQRFDVAIEFATTKVKELWQWVTQTVEGMGGWAHVQELLREKLVVAWETITDLASAVKTVLPYVDEAAKLWIAWKAALITWNTAMAGYTVITSASGAISNLGGVLPKVTSAITGMSTSMLGPVGLVAGVGAASVAFGLWVGKMQSVHDSLVPIFQSILDKWYNLTSTIDNKSEADYQAAVQRNLEATKKHLQSHDKELDQRFGHSTWVEAFQNLAESAERYFGQYREALAGALTAATGILQGATPVLLFAAGQILAAGEQIERGGGRAVVGGQEFRLSAEEIAATSKGTISPALKEVLESIEAQNVAMAEAAEQSGSFADQLTSDWGRIGDAATEAGERASQVTSLFEENSEALRRAGVAGVTNLSDYAAQLAYLQERLGMTQDELLQQHLADMTRTLRAGVITWGEFGSAIYLQTFGEFLADLAEQNGFAAGQIEEQQRALSEDLLALTQHLQSGMTSTWSSMMGHLVDTTADGGDLITVAMEGMAQRSREALDSISSTAVVSAGAVARSAESIRAEVSRAIESVRGLPGGLVTVGLAGEARAGGGVTSHPIVKVGERGPELVALPAGSRVMSHADMMAAVRGFASGGIVGLQDIVRSQRMTDQFRAMQDTFQGIHFGQTREERRAEARAWVAGIEWANAIQLRNQMEAEIRAIVRQAQVQAEAQRRIAALGLPTSGGGTTTGGGGTTSAGSLYVPSSGFGMLDSGFSAMLSALSPMPGSSGSGGSGAQGNVTISGPIVHVEHVDASNPADVDMLLERISDVFLQRLSQAGLSVNVGVA